MKLDHVVPVSNFMSSRAALCGVIVRYTPYRLLDKDGRLYQVNTDVIKTHCSQCDARLPLAQLSTLEL